jgi:hypothetical protein
LVGRNKRLQFIGRHLSEAFQGHHFTAGVLVENKDHILAIVPLLNFQSKYLGQMRGTDFADTVIFVYHYRHVVRGAKQRAHHESKQTKDARTFHSTLHCEKRLIKASRFCLEKPSGKLRYWLPW